MDHAEALELIEIAAAEPDGLERLMAGDTPDSIAAAGHLAGCPACVEELAAIRRVSVIARAAVAELPDPALKERTLALVRAAGVDRSAREAPSRAVEPVRSERRRSSAGAWAGIAAALLLVGVAGYAAGGGLAGPPAHEESEVAVLAAAAGTAMSLLGQPGTQVVTLEPVVTGEAATGLLAFNGTSGELVMMATGLAGPGDGAEYGCWVEVDGERRRIGTMYPAGDAWAWSGPAPDLAGLPPGTTFGVSLVPPGGEAGEPVLVGGL